MDIQTADQYLNFKQNLMSGGTFMDTNVDENDFLSSPISRPSNEIFTSPWLGVTSNSECGYSSGCESENEGDSSLPPTRTLRPGRPANTSDRSKLLTVQSVPFLIKKNFVTVSCTLWHDNEATKVEMSVLDISSVITNKVETMSCSSDYIYIGVLLSVLLAWVPVVCRLCEVRRSE